MKKCKITLEESGTKVRYFYLFPESSMLHSLAAASSKKNQDTLFRKHPEVEIVTLKRGQWIEAEWNGCHICYNDKKEPISASFLRLIKAAVSPKNKEGTLLSVHFGWILSDQMRFVEGTRDGIKTQILEEVDEQFDFSELFQDNETVEDLIKKQEKESIM